MRSRTEGINIQAADVNGDGKKDLVAANAGDPNPIVKPEFLGNSVGVILFRLYGDVNGDAAVNGLDLTAFRHAFGSISSDASYSAAFDFDGDGAINGTDAAQFRNRFGVILP